MLFLIRSIINVFEFVSLLHDLHRNQQSYILFTYRVKIVDLNKRNSTLSKWQKSTHYRNSCEAWKIMLLSNLCSLCASDSTLNSVCSAMMRFHHNSMRTRSIFDIIDYLNSAHFVLQNKFSIVCFTYWMQMLLQSF